jgi:hypothetical protein
MWILLQSLFMEESNQLTCRLFGIYLIHLHRYLQSWRMIAKIPALRNDLEPSCLELPLPHLNRAERLELIPIYSRCRLCLTKSS